jgi:diacylglycerol O-acyltransferase / wax synthase
VQQLSGLDSVFLEVEDDHQALHIAQLLVLDRPGPDFEPYPAWRRQLADRMHLLTPLRRRLVEVPFGLDHPYWIDDPDFDLDFHVRHSAVAPPGDDAALDTLVARLVRGRMDRDHPLWVSHVIEGLADDRFAVLTMIHHAAVDGVAGADLLALMLDDAPDAEPPSHAGEWAPESEPPAASVLAQAVVHGVTRPARGLVLGARFAQQLAAGTRSKRVIDLADRVRAGLRGPVGDVLNLGRTRDPDQRVPRLPSLPPPRAPFNEPISRYRRFAHRSLPLAEVKELAKGTESTINDVVVAMCSGGLRRFLVARGELPEAPLTAGIPVSLRTGEEDDPWTNRVSAMIASLPTDIGDPGDRLTAAHEALEAAKALQRVSPAALIPEAAELGVPAIGDTAARLASRWVVGAPRAFNLFISNVPGPSEPLYLAGARLGHYIPVSAIADGQGLNITVQSYVDSLDFGLLACAELIPDLDDLADAVVDELAALREAVSS